MQGPLADLRRNARLGIWGQQICRGRQTLLTLRDGGPVEAVDASYQLGIALIHVWTSIAPFTSQRQCWAAGQPRRQLAPDPPGALAGTHRWSCSLPKRGLVRKPNRTRR